MVDARGSCVVQGRANTRWRRRTGRREPDDRAARKRPTARPNEVRFASTSYTRATNPRLSTCAMAMRRPHAKVTDSRRLTTVAVLPTLKRDPFACGSPRRRHPGRRTGVEGHVREMRRFGVRAGRPRIANLTTVSGPTKQGKRVRFREPGDAEPGRRHTRRQACPARDLPCRSRCCRRSRRRPSRCRLATGSS